MIDISEAENVIFQSAMEDYTGLYEIIWEFNSLYKSESLGEKYRVAEIAVRNLLNQNKIELLKATNFCRSGEPEYSKIKKEYIESTLLNPVSWWADHGNVTIVFTEVE